MIFCYFHVSLQNNKEFRRNAHIFFCLMNETPRGKQRGIKISATQDKSRSKLRGTNPKRD
jgi:hypothetical protein